MEMDCNLKKIRLNFSKSLKRVDIKSILIGHGLFRLNEIKLICSFKRSNTMLLILAQF